MEAELTVAFLAFTERYTSRVTCVPYESVKVRFPLTLFGKDFDCFFGGVGDMSRLLLNQLRLCSRPSRQRGAFIQLLPLRHHCTKVTAILPIPRPHDRSRARKCAAKCAALQPLRMMSVRHRFRSSSLSRLRIRFTLPYLVPFLGRCPG
jgi:hypothetical protein